MVKMPYIVRNVANIIHDIKRSLAKIGLDFYQFNLSLVHSPNRNNLMKEAKETPTHFTRVTNR